MKIPLPPMLLALLLMAGSAKANQLTVSNTAAPGQYNTLQAAITAAKNGDTILVSGSATDYAAAAVITINKKIMLLGPGYNPIKDKPLCATISQIDLQSGSSGTAIIGFIISQQLFSDAGVQVNNILVKRNSIYSVNFSGVILNDAQGDNWLIQENIIGYGSVAFNGNNIVIKNNLINASYQYGSIANNSNNTSLLFANNDVFTLGQPLNFYNALITNNIFYDASGADIVYFPNSYSCNFSNNLVYNNPDPNPLNTGSNGNLGFANQFNTNANFTLVTIANDAWGQPDWVYPISSQNLALLSSSTGHNAGSDGRDIGIYGGGGAQNPLTGEPAIPLVTTMNVLITTAAPGGPVNTAVKAKSNN